MRESLSGGRRREIQEDGIVMAAKFFLFKMFSLVVERGELGEAKCDLVIPTLLKFWSLMRPSSEEQPMKVSDCLQNVNKVRFVCVLMKF